MSTPNFDFDSQVHRLDEPIGEADQSTDDTHRMWGGRLSSNWSIGSVPNGGYSAGLILRGLLDHTGYNTPLSLTTHYYRPTIADADVEIRTDIQRRGRTTTHADGVLIQDGKVRVRCIGVFGDLPADDVLLAASPPAMPGPEACPERDPLAQGLNMTLLESLEVRLHPDTPLPTDGNVARIDGWVRFRDGRPNDALGLCLFADAFPPAILSAVPETGWVPTIELTTHVRAAAAPGWVRGQITTSNMRGGYLVEDARLWDSTGTLVVEARQLALLRT